MSAPDIARVLAAHRRECFDEWCGECLCGWLVPEDAKDFTAAHRAHVADAIRAELRAWLKSEGAFNVASGAIIDARDAFPRRPDDAPSDDVARAALAALAEQVWAGVEG